MASILALSVILWIYILMKHHIQLCQKTHRLNSVPTKYLHTVYTCRAPQCMSPRWNWDSPTPLAAERLEKRLALCLLCVRASSVKFTIKYMEIWKRFGALHSHT